MLATCKWSYIQALVLWNTVELDLKAVWCSRTDDDGCKTMFLARKRPDAILYVIIRSGGCYFLEPAIQPWHTLATYKWSYIQALVL